MGPIVVARILSSFPEFWWSSIREKPRNHRPRGQHRLVAHGSLFGYSLPNSTMMKVTAYGKLACISGSGTCYRSAGAVNEYKPTGRASGGMVKMTCPR